MNNFFPEINFRLVVTIKIDKNNKKINNEIIIKTLF